MTDGRKLRGMFDRDNLARNRHVSGCSRVRVEAGSCACFDATSVTLATAVIRQQHRARRDTEHTYP
jgi:hypothetical protein